MAINSGWRGGGVIILFCASRGGSEHMKGIWKMKCIFAPIIICRCHRTAERERSKGGKEWPLAVETRPVEEVKDETLPPPPSPSLPPFIAFFQSIQPALSPLVL